MNQHDKANPVLARALIAGAMQLALAMGTAFGGVTDPPKREPLPSLDELLGLPNASIRGRERDKKALDQKLQGGKDSEDMDEAVELMAQSAERLTAAKDPGLPTQRLQEDALKKLDKLIEQAEQNQKQQKSKSQQKKQQQSQDQQQQQQRQQSQQDAERDPNGTAQSEAMAPAKQDARPNALSPAAQAAWGNLPEHMRQALVQGASDRFSSLYQSLTEAYYRRLAEEPREKNP